MILLASILLLAERPIVSGAGLRPDWCLVAGCDLQSAGYLVTLTPAPRDDW